MIPSLNLLRPPRPAMCRRLELASDAVLIHAARRRKTAHEPIPEPIEWSVEALDYPTGKAQVDAAVGDNEVLLWVRVER